MYYATQVDVAPPTFTFFVNDAELVHFSYQRFLENQIRMHHAFEGTPIKLVFRNRSEILSRCRRCPSVGGVQVSRCQVSSVGGVTWEVGKFSADWHTRHLTPDTSDTCTHYLTPDTSDT